MSYKLRELRELPEAELIELYDQAAIHTSVGLNYYADELNRRSNEKTNKIMKECTVWITVMTAVMLITTLINVFIVIIRSTCNRQVAVNISSNTTFVSVF